MSKQISEEDVFKMLKEAYKAGFEGPLELLDEACKEIIADNNYKESDVELMDYAGKQKGNKLKKSINKSSDSLLG